MSFLLYYVLLEHVVGYISSSVYRSFSVEFLHEDQSLILRSYMKNPGMVVPAYNSKAGRWKPTDPSGSMASQPHLLSKLWADYRLFFFFFFFERFIYLFYEYEYTVSVLIVVSHHVVAGI